MKQNVLLLLVSDILHTCQAFCCSTLDLFLTLLALYFSYEFFLKNHQNPCSVSWSTLSSFLSMLFLCAVPLCALPTKNSPVIMSLSQFSLNRSKFTEHSILLKQPVAHCWVNSRRNYHWCAYFCSEGTRAELALPLEELSGLSAHRDNLERY